MNYKKTNDYEVLYMIRENEDIYLPLLFKKYKPLISKIAAEYLPSVKKHGLEFDDLFQECSIALEEAVKTFRNEYNVVFYTYACVCMKRKMFTLVRNYNRGNNLILSNCDFEIDVSNVADEEADFSNKEAYAYVQTKLCELLNSSDLIDSSIMELRINGFSYKEISELLDVPVTKIQSSLYLMRRSLKTEFGK